MTDTVHLDDATMAEAIAHLVACDADFARVVATRGAPPLRQAAPGFATLLPSTVGQQLSVKAAASIWNRLIALLDPLTPAAILAASDEALRGVGLSGGKMRFARALAADVQAGRI